MAVVHRVFRREFGALPAYIRAVRAGDTDRAAVPAEHLHDLLTGLHHHHEAEDRMLWPLLLERASLEKDLIHTMEAQHERVAFLAKLPVVARIVWKLVGRRQYAAATNRIRTYA